MAQIASATPATTSPFRLRMRARGLTVSCVQLAHTALVERGVSLSFTTRLVAMSDDCCGGKGPGFCGNGRFFVCAATLNVPHIRPALQAVTRKQTACATRVTMEAQNRAAPSAQRGATAREVLLKAQSTSSPVPPTRILQRRAQSSRIARATRPTWGLTQQIASCVRQAHTAQAMVS